MFLVPPLVIQREPIIMSDDFYNTLFGAIVGGVVTLLVSVIVNALVAVQHEKDRRLGLGYSIRYKVMRLADAVVKLHRSAFARRPLTSCPQVPCERQHV